MRIFGTSNSLQPGAEYRVAGNFPSYQQLRLATGSETTQAPDETAGRTTRRAVDDRTPIVVTRQGGKGNVVVLSEANFAGRQYPG